MNYTKIKILITVMAVVASTTRIAAQGCSTMFSYTTGAFGATQFSSTSVPSSGLTYSWTFPGASPSTAVGANPLVTYTINGLHVASLTVSVSSTCTATYTQFVTIGNASCALAPSFSLSTAPNGSVNFTNLSAGTSTSTAWTWFLGGSAGTSTMTNPSASYTANGTYSVILTATNSPTCYASITSVITITNICTLNSSFNFAQTPGGGIIYGNTSTGTFASTSYTWQLGDTAHAYISSPVHTYSATGMYTVTLTASNGGTCVSSSTLAVSVCSLDFVATPSVVGLVHFNGTASPTNASTFYYWYFGDGGWAQGVTANPTVHTYTSNGTYSVTFGISSSVPMCSVNITKPITVNCGPTAAFSFSQGVNGSVSFFNNTTNTVSGSFYLWKFGDGDSSSAHSPTHTYPFNSSYTATLTAFNGLGCSSTVTMVIPVNTYSCKAGFNYVVSGNVVSFTSTSTPQMSTSVYGWNFGNGSSSLSIGSTAAVSTYTAAGSYTVFHSIKHPFVCSDSITKIIQITNPCALTASFSAFKDSTGTLLLTNLTTGTNSGTSYTWQSGNGQTTNSHHAVFSYSSNGFYVVTLTASNQGIPGCTSTHTMLVQITSVPCTVNSSFTHTLTNGGTVNFSSFGNTLPGSHYYWNFGDGTTGTGPLPSHTYLNGGAHQVTHIVTRDSLCSDTTILSINITGISCQANPGFTLFPSGVPQHWTAIPSYPWNVIAAEWQWGDGTSSPTLYATHQYSIAGNYIICLSVTVSCAQSASSCATYSVYRASESAQIVYVNVERPALIPAGIAQIEQDERVVTIYPNPTDGPIFLAAKSGVLIQEISVFDVTGRKVYSQAFPEINPGEARMVTLDLPEGLYYTQVKLTGAITMKKILIKK